MPQDQRSTFDQLLSLLELANKNGLYDAADWLQRELDSWYKDWNKVRIRASKRATDEAAPPPNTVERHQLIDWLQNGISDYVDFTLGSLPGHSPALELWEAWDGGDNSFHITFRSAEVKKSASFNKTKIFEFINNFLKNKRLVDTKDVLLDELMKQFGMPPELARVAVEQFWSKFWESLGFQRRRSGMEDKIAAVNGHYIWEANGDEAIIVSPDHQVKYLSFEEAQPFWAKLFELEEQISDTDQLQLAIDDYCATYFTNEPSVEPVVGSFKAALLKRGSDLHNRVEKASTELAELWKKVTPAQAKGYAIEHHLHLVKQNLKQGLELIPSQPEVASVHITMAEEAIRKASEEISHLKL